MTKKNSKVTAEKQNKEELRKRTLEEDLSFIEVIDGSCLRIKKGFVPNMNVEGRVFVNEAFKQLLLDELKHFHESRERSFIPALMQVANVASLPGIMEASIGLPDIHSGYGFAIGNVAGFDLSDPAAVVSPGGVGFDINCGVRLLRTNLNYKDVGSRREELTKALYEHIPVGLRGQHNDIFKISREDLEQILASGMNWAVSKGYAWPEDQEHCEAHGCLPNADPSAVSDKARSRGFGQLGTLGSGNHYAEIQIVDEIYDPQAAAVFGIQELGQLCVMIHSGSRGLGHQVATDAVEAMEETQSEQLAHLNDRQLACVPIGSPAGQKYLQAMACAANFAFVNRSLLAAACRLAFSKVFGGKSARDLGMHVVYDVAHNIAKQEEHMVTLADGTRQLRSLLVHRKGSTRAFPPAHADIPRDYAAVGQPVLVGGSMGTFSFVLVGTQAAMDNSLGSTCHGAGRAMGRFQAKRALNPDDVLKNLADQGISICVGSKQSITEEAPEAYKDVNEVIDICKQAGLSKPVFRLKPIGVIKG